jgi:hypothetical protein
VPIETKNIVESKKNGDLINIGALKDCQFFVPSYQRGYRWTKSEVTELLDDINEFSTENGTKIYCLQPLIVKKSGEKYEVVDGQQRLTTIFIFMKVVSQKIPSKGPLFSLEYETREDSATFLNSLSDKNIAQQDKNIALQDKNIDYYHIVESYKTIKDWFGEPGYNSANMSEMYDKIVESVFFIWYKLSETEDPISKFSEVNRGRIYLTNAELIKAALLNKENFSGKFEKDQVKISLEWDCIERRLRDDSFWLFLNNEKQDRTRIDMIFDLLVHKKIKEDENNKDPLYSISKDDNYFSYLVSALRKCAKDEGKLSKFVTDEWNEARELYEEFQKWYNDLDMYHIIGFLIATNTNTNKIIQEILNETKDKSKAEKTLLDMVINTFANDDKFYNDIEKYEYHVHDAEIRNVLLLFNISTLVCKSEKQERFPFDLYKETKWDIEHIHATADDTDKPDDSLGNLTLLDRITNRKPDYAKKSFDVKSEYISKRENEGLFVPLCTKHIFLNNDDKKLWNDDDKNNYIEQMKETFRSFFKKRQMPNG